MVYYRSKYKKLKLKNSYKRVNIKYSKKKIILFSKLKFLKKLIRRFKGGLLKTVPFKFNKLFFRKSKLKKINSRKIKLINFINKYYYMNGCSLYGNVYFNSRNSTIINYLKINKIHKNKIYKSKKSKRTVKYSLFYFIKRFR